MSDLPVPMVGPVYGWRTWTLHTDALSKWTDTAEASLVSRGTVWDTPRQQARCGDAGISAWSYSMIRAMDKAFFGTTSPEPTPDHEPAADPHCWCGLYAHGTLARCLDANDMTLRMDYPMLESDRRALGLVRAWGRMHAADRGFRAQHMTIDTLVCLRHQSSPITWGHQPGVHQIAADLGVPVVCIKKRGVASVRRQFDRAFADREGVTLWRKEAPWISELTRRPSKSSTPTSGATFDWTDPGGITSPSLTERTEQSLSLSDMWDGNGGAS